MKKLNIMFILAVLTLVWGCKDSGNEEQRLSQLTEGDEARPSWTAPNYGEYEFIMSVQFRLQDELAEYVTNQDLMCAMIDGKVSAVTAPHVSEEQIYFPLSIAANGTDGMVSILYYCDRLHRIFVIEEWHQYDSSMAPTDENGEPYLLKFITTE